MFTQSPRLFMMSSLALKTAIAAVRAPTSSEAVNIYPAAIIAAPSGLWATSLLGKQSAEMGNKWAVCIWQRREEPPAARVMTCTCGERSARSVTCDVRLASVRGLDPQGQQPGWVTFYQASLCCPLVKDEVHICCVWLRARGGGGGGDTFANN